MLREDLTVVQRNQTDNVPTATFTTDIKEIDAPLKAGTLVGKLQLKDQDLIGKGYISEQASVDMIIPSDMKEASWPFSWWNQFVRYVNENYKIVCRTIFDILFLSQSDICRTLSPTSVGESSCGTPSYISFSYRKRRAWKV